ncbi:MAG: hypothetical protein WA603_21625, partial [Candidatus Acidiferrales bacterium]
VGPTKLALAAVRLEQLPKGEKFAQVSDHKKNSDDSAAVYRSLPTESVSPRSLEPECEPVSKYVSMTENVPGKNESFVEYNDCIAPH